MADFETDELQRVNKRFENGIHSASIKCQNEVKKHITYGQLRHKASQLRAEVTSQFENQLTDLVDDFVTDMEKLHGDGNSDSNGSANYNPKKMRSDHLPDKVYVSRRSLLTDLLEISHIQTIYHIFVAILIIFTLNTVVSDIVNNGKLGLDFGLMTWAFGNPSFVMMLWVVMTMSSLVLVYILFTFWAQYRRIGCQSPSLFDYAWLVVYIVYQILFMVLPLQAVFHYQLPPVSTMIIICEQVRYLMKSHAFVRENIPRVMSYKVKTEEETETEMCPDFSRYLYFLFVPALVYRDTYPQSPSIRWSYVVKNFMNVIGCVFYMYFIIERFVVPVFHNFNSEHVTPKEFLKSVFGCMMPGTLCLLIGFFAVLHSWMNAFAEMLQFGDRMFYRDWWNSTSFSNYYRTWNVVVHDWLYTYVYKDTCRLLKVKNRGVAMLLVFLLSAVFHEYILCASMGFFYPVLLVMFVGAGFGFIFLTKKGVSRSWNVFMWVALFIGNGLLMCLYSMEWYARRNCKYTTDSFLDYLIPRSWFCVEHFSII